MKQSHQQSEKIVGVWNVFWYGVLFRAAANTTGKELASEAYRQVSYVNDVTRANEQVLVEYTTDGVLGNSATSYTYGVQRESYAMTRNAAAAGGVTEALISYSSGAYYYTGTGSVSNLISSGGSYAYTYAEYGARTVYRLDTNVAAISDTCESYGYNGEYTHETLGIQYLRARYYNMTTGTFTSKDTYAGRIESILSQNRYTYAENNPINFADPSGHAKTKNRLPSLQDNIRVAKGGNGPALKPTVNNPTDAAKAAYQSRRDAAGLPKENTLLDNVRIYNGQEYYNGLLLRTPVSALMSPVGGSLTFAESIAAKVEAARCMAYDRCENAVQESILEGKSKRNEDILLAVGSSVILEDFIVHIKPPKGNYYDFRDALGSRESTDSYSAASGSYIGRYQLGKSALIDIGFMDSEGNWTEKAGEYGINSIQSFYDNPEVQDMAFDMYVDVQKSYIEHFELDQYIGQEMNGVTITESGLIAAAHLIGIGGLRSALVKRDLMSEKDDNGTTAKEYMDTFGGYDLNETK